MHPLATVRPGETARLGPPEGVDPDLLRELWAMRILPGEPITVVAVIGRGGPVLVQSAGGVYALGRRLAGQLQAEVLTA